MTATIVQEFFFFFSYDVDIAKADALHFDLQLANGVGLSLLMVESFTFQVVQLVLDQFSTPNE